jgi:hypothetical protein
VERWRLDLEHSRNAKKARQVVDPDLGGEKEDYLGIPWRRAHRR